MNWKYKAAIQNALGKLPPKVGNPIYYRMQRMFGGLRRTTPLSRLRAGVELVRRIRRFERKTESAVFLEIGTGHQLALPLSLWLCGASEISTVDLNRYLKETLVIGDIQYLRNHENEVRSLFAGIAPTTFEERFQRLLSSVNSLGKLLSLTNIRYWAPADASCLPLESSSIDYHISYTVLEHIPVPVLKQVFREGCRVLKPNGLFIHYIDFTDHFAETNEAISSVNFLQFSESEWQRLAGNRYMFHNRLRVDEFQEAMLDSGLEILALDSRVDDRAIDVLRNEFPVNERFRTKDWSTNATKNAWLVASPGRICATERSRAALQAVT